MTSTMPQQFPSRAYEIFRTALDRPDADRESLIASFAVAEPEAAAEAAKLLRDFEDQDDDPGSAFVLPEWARDREGTIVGGWHVERRLGTGGFGSVYRAFRCGSEGVEEAAVKFLDIAPHQTLRFSRERQVLADLNHEGICKFIDGGTTQGGVPYLVMEYVAGLPISRYCDRERKTITQRVQIFIKLCRAIEYAHDHQVLHGDLKPENVLVTAAGAVRVLDFGVAKLLSGGPCNPERLTKPGDAPFTKAYASPEQVADDLVSFATDVYSLGVLLYELVAGQLPFSNLALNGSDWRMVVLEQNPLPPSQTFLIGTQGSPDPPGGVPAETAARFRGGSPSKLKRVLSGELDAVILRALDKRPSRRYQRVQSLREDIERFLDGSPVTARRIGLWERSWIWSRRHRAVAALSAVWTACLLVLLHAMLLADVHFESEMRDEQHAIQRLRYLSQEGVPSIEQSVGHSNTTLVNAVVKVHTSLLKRIDALPAYARSELDQATAVSALACARVWQDLGDSAAGLAATEAIAPRIAKRHREDLRDPEWRALYGELLREQVTLHIRVGDLARSDCAKRLAELEREE